MKRKLILIALIASLSLTGCGPIGDDNNAGNDGVSSVSEDVTDADENSEEQTIDDAYETDDHEISEPENPEFSEADENAEFKYFRVTGNDEWSVYASDTEYNTIWLQNNENHSAMIGVIVDDEDEYGNAVYASGEFRSYKEKQRDDFILNERVDFYGTEAIHHISVDNKGDYTEHYFFDGENGVVYIVTILCDYDFYRENRESADDILKNAEFFCAGTSEKEDKLTMQDIVDANRLTNVLSRFDSVKTELKSGIQSTSVYAEDGFAGISDLLRSEGQIGDRICEFDDGEYRTMFTFEPSVNLYERYFFMDGKLEYFKITDIREKGKKTIVTAKIEETVSEVFLEDMDIDVNDEYPPAVTAEITLDPDTLFIDKIELTKGEGLGKKEILSMKCEYNAKKGLVLNQMYEHMTTDDLRTITAVVNPGMKNEYTVSVKGVKGDEIQFVEFGDRVPTGKYEDIELQNQYNTGTDKDKNADLKFYAREFF